MTDKFCEFLNEVVCPLAKGDISIKPLLVAGVGIYIMLVGCRFMYKFKFEIRVIDLIYALFCTPYLMLSFFWGLMFVNESVFILFAPVYPVIILQVISRIIKKAQKARQ